MKHKTMACVAVLAAALAASAVLAAEDGAKWESGVNAGLNLTRGNSETMLINGGIKADRKGDANEVSLGAEGNYGETEVVRDGETVTEDNINNAKGYAKYRRLFDDRNYAYLNADILHDEIADIQYRAVVGPGLGRYLLKDDRQTLGVEAGVGYLFEEVSNTNDDYVVARVAQTYSLQVSQGAKIWESVEYLPRVDDMEQYLINAELGAEAAMTEKVSLRVVVQEKYNSEPAAGKEYNDLTVIAGASYKL